MAQAPHKPEPKKDRKPRVARFNKDTPPEVRFKVLAEERVSRAIKALDAVGKLTGKNYAHTTEQRAKINDALTEALGNAIGRLASGGKATSLFKL